MAVQSASLVVSGNEWSSLRDHQYSPRFARARDALAHQVDGMMRPLVAGSKVPNVIRKDGLDGWSMSRQKRDVDHQVVERIVRDHTDMVAVIPAAPPSYP